MNDEEIMSVLTKIDKKQDKILSLLTKIAKALHLVPVTEAEERRIQVQQRSNLALSAKINSELNAMENKPDKSEDVPLNLENLIGKDDVYSDVLADDYLGG